MMKVKRCDAIMIITFDGDGGGIGAHTRHWIGDAILAERLDCRHACLHPILNSFIVSNGLAQADAIQIIDGIRNCVTRVLWLEAYDCIEYLEEDYNQERGSTVILSGKHHYSQVHNSFLGTWSRNDLFSVYRRHSLGSEEFGSLGTRLQGKLKLTMPYASIQIRTFIDSEDGRKNFLKSYSCLLDQLVSELHSSDQRQYFLTADDSFFREDIARILSEEGFLVVSTDEEFEHSSFLFYYLKCKGVIRLSSLSTLCDYLIECAHLANDGLKYCENAMAELSVLSMSTKIISTYSSYPIVASMLGSVNDLIILSGITPYLQTEGTF